MNSDNLLVMTCYSWAPCTGDYLFTCGAISRLPHGVCLPDMLPCFLRKKTF